MSFALLPVADDLAIRSLMARYAHATDAGDAAGFAALFIEEGRWTRENSPPLALGGSGLPSETLVGREQLMGLIERAIVGRFRRLVRHQMTDLLVEPGDDGPDHARGSCRALITDWTNGAGKVAMCGTYRSTFRRTAQGWRFESVSVSVLPTA